MKNWQFLIVYFVSFSLYSQEKLIHHSSRSPISEATYPGGYSEMIRFINEHLEIPDDFYGVGRVNLRFTVSETGMIKDIQVRRGIEGCATCSESAIKVLKKMPHWKPAYSYPEKKEVESYVVLPIKFERPYKKQ